MSDQRISISLSSIVSILVVVLLILLLSRLQDLLIVLMISVVLAASIAPIVNWAERRQMPRWLAVLFVYLALIGGFVGVGLLIGPTLLTQTETLITQIPVYTEALYGRIQDLAARLNSSQPNLVTEFVNPQALSNWLIRSGQQLLLRSYGLTKGIVGGVLEAILVLLISAYMLAGSKSLLDGLTNLFPHPWDRRLRAQVKPVSQRMGGFIQGRAIVSIILGVVITIGLSLLGLSQFALALGVFAGATNLIPFVGPLLGAVPALLVAISTGGWTWVWVLLLFLIVQNLEGNILTPLLIGSSVKLHPLYLLLAVIGGTEVLGVLGALVVPPWVAGAAVLLENLYLRPKAIGEARADRSDLPDDENPSVNSTETPISIS
ncbi:AI-2E family transporter [Leptolyngbya sp. FACHB-36]|uniref:AI-2E family transporter n=1 Tax=Leptolyngbya sp. FACHB-36 TaxID=2692808 RepID=UPI0016806AF1|nr:AI-2E family transporter [Leptolyngbya sp. FACHB-36]MBD2022031.1 AI-2E family transporter [Leptolyngbya sp. FACHB-36]